MSVSFVAGLVPLWPPGLNRQDARTPRAGRDYLPCTWIARPLRLDGLAVQLPERDLIPLELQHCTFQLEKQSSFSVARLSARRLSQLAFSSAGFQNNENNQDHAARIDAFLKAIIYLTKVALGNKFSAIDRRCCHEFERPDLL
jgi:hypothetical protein